MNKLMIVILGGTLWIGGTLAAQNPAAPRVNAAPGSACRCDHDGNGTCDRCGRPVGQGARDGRGRGRGPAMGFRGGMNRPLAFRGGMGRGWRAQQERPVETPQAPAAPQSEKK